MKTTWLGGAACAALVFAMPAFAGDKVLTGTAPAWVEPAPDPDPAARSASDAISLLDEQLLIDGDTSVTYVDAAQVLATPQDLQKAGRLTVNWQPDHGDVTFHRIEVVRDGERIDMLGDGSEFSVLRREARLESQIIDGRLTATRQLEGLRLGDLVRFSFSIASHDPVLDGKAQGSLVMIPEPVKIDFGRARVIWPENQDVNVRTFLPDFALAATPIKGGFKEIRVDFPVAKLEQFPKDVPARFHPVPVLVASNFAGWEQLSSSMAPLYDPAGMIAEGSDLAKAVDRIAAEHSALAERMAAALRLVQSDVRYMLVALGTGNYAPQAPADTWAMRYGDCKAKTLLLLAMLDRLGIEAEAVLASISGGDRVPLFPASPQAFDHVFVHAMIGGEDYWLDGTSLGTRLADVRDVPRFGHVLPLRSGGKGLLALPTRADARPSPAVSIVYDQTAGAHLPAPFTMSVTYAGAAAEQLHAQLSSANEENALEYAEKLSKDWTGSTTVLRPTSTYDAENATLRIDIEGVAYPGWSFVDGRMEMESIPHLRFRFDPDRSTSVLRPLPALVQDPWTSNVDIITRLPAEAATATFEGFDPVSIDEPAVSYRFSAMHEGTTLTERVELRETGDEVPSEDIPALRRAASRLSTARSRIVLPADYPERWIDAERMRKSPALAKAKAIMDARITQDPDSAWAYSDRAWLAERLFDRKGAIQLYTKAIDLEAIADHYLDRSRLRLATGDVKGAVADAQAAFDLDTSNNDARHSLAYMLALEGRADEALGLLPDDADASSDEGRAAIMTKAEVLLYGDRPDESIGLLDGILGRRATSPELLNSRCWIKAMANVDLANALVDCSRAIELSAQPAAYFESRAWVYLRQGELDKALADADAALAIDPELAATRYLRGIVASRKGLKDDADRDFAAARMVDPSVESDFARFGLKP